MHFMIRYHLIVFVRNLFRQKMFSFINLLGLTTGIFSSLLIYMYVKHEISYDRFHQNAGKIYRINQTFIWGQDNDQLFSSLGPGVFHAIAAEIPEAKEVTRIHPPGNSLMSYAGSPQTKSFDQTGILAVDSNFLRVFTYPMIKGDPLTALQQPNSIVMTESCAKKYFGDEEPVGKLIQGGNTTLDQTAKTLVVTGVVQDPPENSYIDFEVLMSMATLPRVRNSSWSWIWTMFETYVLLDDHASVHSLNSKLANLPRKYAETTIQNAMGASSFDEFVKKGKQWNLIAQPLTEIHLHSGTIYNRFPNAGNIRTIYVLTGIVGFIILLSCINFMNLSTAQYTKRARETSLRKVLGSTRRQLGNRFFLEAFLFCSISMVFGIGLTQLFIPLLNQVSGTTYSFSLLSDVGALGAMITVVVLMSLLSGSYPALFLSAFTPVDALKGKFRSGKEGRTIRNSLVTFQFATALILIVSTIVVFQQLHYLSEKDTGFDRENLLVLSRLEWIKDKDTFLDEALQLQGVEHVSWCSSVPPRLYDGDSFQAEGNQDQTINLNYVKADENIFSTLKLSLAAGRNFSNERPSDRNGVILNEVAVRKLGWRTDESTLGKRIHYPGGDLWFEVIGIVRDFNYWSLQGPVEPMAIFSIYNPIFFSNQEFAALRLSVSGADQWNGLISSLTQTWRKFAGDAPFQYEFVDQAFAESFREQEVFSKALGFFAGLTILIAAVGLLGMIVFTLELKTKEIGIRKVIGATVWNILFLISKEYAKLIVIAIVISIPISLWILNEWLKSFTYHIEPGPMIFVTAGLLTLFLAMLITGYHSVKAALTNPVDVLKNE